MIAIAAMDIIDGSCVRLCKGDYASKRVYGMDPVQMAKNMESSGLKRLHLVDLDGAKTGHVVNHGILKRIAQETGLVVDVGGGLKSEDDFSTVFDNGAAMATVGSLAAKDRHTAVRLLRKWGPDRLLLGADCRDGLIAVSGWTQNTSLPLHDFVKEYVREGFTSVVSTDIARDGMLSGPAVAMYRELLAVLAEAGWFPSLIASGGVRNLGDLDELAKVGLSGAIVGKALYEGSVTAASLASWQAAQED